MKKKEIEMMLEELEELPTPKLSLEQYTIPSSLAAEILTLAFLSGDIKDKVIADLGCGSGRLGIGAALLGAKLVLCVDMDKDAIKVAKRNLRKMRRILETKVFLICSRVEDFHTKVDTVLQNPPFGTKKRHADRVFLKKAMEIGKKVYSLHNNGSKKIREFIQKFVEENGGILKNIIKSQFSIPHLFQFHKKPRKKYYVDLYVIEVKDGGNKDI